MIWRRYEKDRLGGTIFFLVFFVFTAPLNQIEVHAATECIRIRVLETCRVYTTRQCERIHNLKLERTSRNVCTALTTALSIILYERKFKYNPTYGID